MTRLLRKSIFILTLTLAVNALAQVPKEKQVVFTYGNDTAFRPEFERIYTKNSSLKKVSFEEKDIREYLTLFENYKIKVKEAKAMGLDTTAEFKKELAGYRKQLAQNYLTDTATSEFLMKEAYDRMGYEVNASHLMIKIAQDALPKDTIEAWKKIMKLRDRANKGESFDTLAKYFSDDTSLKNAAGNLGYFSAFNMIYAFENAAYTTPVGEISMPVRTVFGYHLVKVNSREPNKGEIKVANLMLNFGGDNSPATKANLKVKIDSIYARLKAGESFDRLIEQYSEDASSAKTKGVVGYFSRTSRAYPNEFKETAFALEHDGDYSAPFATDFGWHIIKRVELKPLASYKDMKEQIRNRIARDTRSQANQDAVVTRIKKESKFKETPKNLDAFVLLVDSSLLHGSWDGKKVAKLNAPLFQLGNKVYTQADFNNYLMNYQTERNTGAPAMVARSMYKDYVKSAALEFEESQLDKKYENFRNLMQEYYEGILLFTITEKMVWNKSTTDSAGLADFHASRASNYMWKERLDAVIFDCLNEKVAKEARKMLKKGVPEDSIFHRLNRKNPLNIALKMTKFERGQNAVIDTIPWKKGLSKNIPYKNRVSFVLVKDILPPQPKKINEARGLITSDYQKYLEEEWIKSLRAKYPIKVDESTIPQLFKN